MELQAHCSSCGVCRTMTRKYLNAVLKKRGEWRCTLCAKSASRLNIVGQRYGRLVVQEMLPPNRHHHSMVRSICDCGNTHISEAAGLRRGSVKSCGCLLAESRGLHTKTHGQSHTRTFNIWMAMRARCRYPSMSSFPIYGGRGIRVCDRWEKFEQFLEDMGEAPPDAQIDRIDNDGNYEPSNCRWATRIEQARNKSTNRYIEFDGERKCLMDWARSLQMDQASLAERISKWGIERALTTPKGR